MKADAQPDLALRPALEELARRDPDLARAYHLHGLPPVRRGDTGFAGLLRIVIGQQVSTASAKAIADRMEALLPAPTPRDFLDLGDEALAKAGFSRAKARYGRALAETLVTGGLDLETLERLPDEEAIAALTAIHGIGRWTAEIYLLFSLRRPDVWPAGDLAVVKALQALKGLPARPPPEEARRLAESWRPQRSAAARLLWHYYRHEGVAL